MAVMKVIELMSSSGESWEDATRKAVAKASETLSNIRSVWVKEQTATVKDGKVNDFRITLKITFEVK